MSRAHDLRGTGPGRLLAAALLLVGAVAIVGLQVVGRDRTSPVTEGDLASIQVAVPDLLGRACLLGTIPFEQDMGGLDAERLAGEALGTLADDVAAVYAPAARAPAEAAARARLERVDVNVLTRLGCSFEVTQFRSITVRAGTAEVEVRGGFREVAFGIGAASPPSTVVEPEPETWIVALERAATDGGWLLLTYEGTRELTP